MVFFSIPLEVFQTGCYKYVTADCLLEGENRDQNPKKCNCNGEDLSKSALRSFGQIGKVRYRPQDLKELRR